MLQWLYTHVSIISSILEVCCISFGCFKSRSGVAHVAMAIHVCVKRMFKCFVYFQTYVASVSFEYLEVDLGEAHGSPRAPAGATAAAHWRSHMGAIVGHGPLPCLRALHGHSRHQRPAGQQQQHAAGESARAQACSECMLQSSFKRLLTHSLI
jgi:hypothetical protein